MRKQIKAIYVAIVEKTACDKRFLKKDKISASDGWLDHFLSANPQLLTLRKGDCTVAIRMNDMNNQSDLDNYS